MFELMVQSLLTEAEHSHKLNGHDKDSWQDYYAKYMAPRIIKWIKLNQASLEGQAYCLDEPDDDPDSILCSR